MLKPTKNNFQICWRFKYVSSSVVSGKLVEDPEVDGDGDEMQKAEFVVLVKRVSFSSGLVLGWIDIRGEEGWRGERRLVEVWIMWRTSVKQISIAISKYRKNE